jgi:ferritin-like metal-binding protein YciE
MDNEKTIKNLHDLLDYDAGKFTSAEVQLQKILPDWINKASAVKLKGVLQRYLEQVQQHVQKMEDFFQDENFNSLSLSNRAMKAFIEETTEKLNNCADSEVRDACLLSCIQNINHYKISTYGTAAAFAKALEMEKVASIFHELEINEKQIDDRLSQLAEHEINVKAKAPISLEDKGKE